MKQTEYGVSTQILYDGQYKAVPVTIDSEQVTAENGRKVLPAGTLIKGNAESIFDNRSEKAVSTNGTGSTTVDGILLYDVDVTDGDGTGACVYNGTVWTDNIQADVTTNLKNKLPQITFVQG